MHRDILGLQVHDGLEGDHINRNRLDNTRENLRVVTRRTNAQNQPMHRAKNRTSKYRGVNFRARDGKWCAEIKSMGKRIFFGAFSTEAEAAEAVSAARSRLFTHSVEVPLGQNLSEME